MGGRAADRRRRRPFEWWYFDTHFDDGSAVTVEFHIKPPDVSPKSPLTPFVLVTITGSDGARRDWTVVAEQAQFAAALAARNRARLLR